MTGYFQIVFSSRQILKVIWPENVIVTAQLQPKNEVGVTT
jgi:hypothetical protein